jgi:hypothetical protein
MITTTKEASVPTLDPGVCRLIQAAQECQNIESGLSNGWRVPHERVVEAAKELEAARVAIEVRLRPPVTSEWRPVAELTEKHAAAHVGVWAFRAPGWSRPELEEVRVLGPDVPAPIAVICPDVEGYGFPEGATECRPVNSDGEPVAWPAVNA